MVNKYDNYELKKVNSLDNVPGTIRAAAGNRGRRTAAGKMLPIGLCPIGSGAEPPCHTVFTSYQKSPVTGGSLHPVQ